MNSLLNEMKYNFKKGQRIKYTNRHGILAVGKYLIAGTLDDTIVITTPSGLTRVIPVNSVVAETDYAQLSINALRKIK